MTDKMPIKIQVLNPVYSIVLQKQGYRLSPVLSYNYEYYRQGPYKKVRKTGRSIVIEKLSGKFPTGLLNKAVEYCKAFDIPVEVIYPADEKGVVVNTNSAILPFVPRPYQSEAISTALFTKRGVIQAPTGSGKTFIMAAIATYFPNYSITIVVHTKTLMIQTIKELGKFFPEENIGQIGEGRREYNTRISVAMIQTVHSDLKSQIPEQYKQAAVWAQRLSVVFVDECHHIAKFDSSYANFLTRTLAPVRIGVTATLPTAEEAALALEAFIGPVIYEVKMDKLIEEGSLATPRLKIFKVPEHPELKSVKKYQDVYDQGIVNNRSRNRKILYEASKLVKDKDLTVLMIISRIEHGDNLITLANNMYPELKMIFIKGATDAFFREEVRQALQSKEYDIVIASTIWKEGVDIPSLGAIVNAAGGKSEIATIQTLGRGLRTTPDKSEIVFYDFFDNSHPYLISHFGERITLYFDLGWM